MKPSRPAKRATALDAARKKRPPRILIVDDIEDNREIYRLLFDARGYEVTTAMDGREALSIAARSCPDVIVMDLSMPTMDGWEAIALLRAREESRTTPIVVLTGHVGGEQAQRALAAGANQVCLKPCLPDTMYAEVEALLGSGPERSKRGARAAARRR